MESSPQFLESELMRKFGSGLQGLKDRFQTLMTHLKDILQYTIEINLLI
jgi:hypothetical protein